MITRILTPVIAGALALTACTGPSNRNLGAAPAPRAKRFVRVLDQIEQQDGSCETHRPRQITHVTHSEHWEDTRHHWAHQGWELRTLTPAEIGAPASPATGDSPSSIAERLLFANLTPRARARLWNQLGGLPGAVRSAEQPDPVGRPSRPVTVSYETHDGRATFRGYFDERAHELLAYETSGLSPCSKTMRRIMVRSGQVPRLGEPVGIDPRADVPELNRFTLRRDLPVGENDTLRRGARIRVIRTDCGGDLPDRPIAFAAHHRIYTSDVKTVETAVPGLLLAPKVNVAPKC